MKLAGEEGVSIIDRLRPTMKFSLAEWKPDKQDCSGIQPLQSLSPN
jgi:hypothetical protein